MVERTQRLSQAALESLAVIAYKQPVTRAEIERIRGVDCGGVLKNLMSKSLIIIDGRSTAPGNPILYRTSEYFLEFFGLPSLDQLPQLCEVEEHTESLPKLKLVKPGEGDDDNGDKADESVSQPVDFEEDEAAEDSRGAEENVVLSHSEQDPSEN